MWLQRFFPATGLLFIATQSCVTPSIRSAPDLPTTRLTLCNDASASLRIRPNWAAIFPVPPGRCVHVRVLVGPTALTAHPIARPGEWMGHPAARIDVPPTGALIRWGEVGGIIDVTTVLGTPRWGRCNFPSGFGPRPPPPMTTSRSMMALTPSGQVAVMWRDEMEKWLNHNFICEPGVPARASAPATR